MSKTIRLKESDLTNIVKKILTEKGMGGGGGCCTGGMHCHYGCCGCKGGGFEMGGYFIGGISDGWCCGPDEDPNSPGGAKIKNPNKDNYKKIDHDRGKFDGRASKVIGVDSDIEDQRFEKNMKEGYRKYGCKFLQSRKSLNEDKLTNLFETDRDIREQNTLSKKLRFIESAIKHTKCGTILREQKEGTSISRNDYRRVRKLVYENMNWEAVRYHNNKRMEQNIKRNGRTI